MTLSKMLMPTAGTLILLMAEPALPRTPSTEAPAAVCVKAAQDASKRTGVPLNVLLALTLTETGRRMNGKLTAWPWALNQGGESHWFPNAEAALSYLSDAVGEGETNIDVGCFQLNYRWHGAAFPSLEAMMDPNTNAFYAAQMISGLAGVEEDWMRAAGTYHSKTPDVAKRYLARLSPIYAALEGAQPASISAPDVMRANGFPLLQMAGPRSAGSIVSLGTSGRPFFGSP